MTMHKKHTLLVTLTKPLLWLSQLQRKQLQDNPYDRLASRYTKALARSMAQTKQIKAAPILEQGVQHWCNAIGDGAALCSNAHPSLSGNQKSNILATAADLNETSFGANAY